MFRSSARAAAAAMTTATAATIDDENTTTIERKKTRLSSAEMLQFVKSSGKRHYDILNTDARREITCFLCKSGGGGERSRFSSLVALAEHAERSHGVVIANCEQYVSFQCFACELREASGEKMQEHLRAKHDYLVKVSVVKEFLVISDIVRCKHELSRLQTKPIDAPKDAKSAKAAAKSKTSKKTTTTTKDEHKTDKRRHSSPSRDTTSPKRTKARPSRFDDEQPRVAASSPS